MNGAMSSRSSDVFGGKTPDFHLHLHRYVIRFQVELTAVPLFGSFRIFVYSNRGIRNAANRQISPQTTPEVVP